MAQRRWWLLLPRPAREFPVDLAAVIALVVLTNLSIFLPVVSDSPVRVAFGVGFVVFLPGYAFVAALFPEEGEGARGAMPGEEGGEIQGRGIDVLERIALSFGLSIALVPAIALGLTYTPFGIRLVPVVLTLSAFTVGCALVAAVRRWRLPEEEQFEPPYEPLIADAREELLAPETRTEAVLNVVLALAVVLAVTSVAYALAVPEEGEPFTELYLLAEDEEGDLVADGYPTEFVAGSPESLHVGVGNHEHEPVEYSLVVELHRMGGPNNSTVRERERLRRFDPRVEDNETWVRNHTVAPTTTGQRLRLTYLLYRGEVPAEPTVDDAYRATYLWVNVSASGNETAARVRPRGET